MLGVNFHFILTNVCNFQSRMNLLILMSIFFQVVGDRKGAVFGGLVEAPLRPTNKKKYQVLLKAFKVHSVIVFFCTSIDIEL